MSAAAAGVAVNQAGPAPRPPQGRRRKRRGPPGLSEQQRTGLHNVLVRLVCSRPWHDDLYALVIAGAVLYRYYGEAQERELRGARLYPPGGLLTSMLRCRTCRRWTPPQAVGSSGDCIECHYEGLPLDIVAQIPSAHRFEWAVRDGELGGHLGGGGAYGVRASRGRLRSRTLVRDPANRRGAYVVAEPIETEEGFAGERYYEVGAGGPAGGENAPGDAPDVASPKIPASD